MNDNEIIDTLGGTSALAEKLKVSLPTVSNWKKRGIPARWRPTILNILRAKGTKIDENKFLNIVNVV